MNPRKPIALIAAAGTFGAALLLTGCSRGGDSALPVASATPAGEPVIAFETRQAAAVAPEPEILIPGPDETKAAWREGLALFENRDFAEAAERFEVAARDRSEDAYTMYMLGLARLKSDDLEGAATALERSAALDPTRVKTFVNLARARMACSDPERAQDAAGAAIDLDPECVPALHQLGRALAARNLRDEAIETLARAHALDPDDGYVANTYGWVLLQAGRTDEALPLLEIAKGKLPGVAYVRNNLGVAYERLARREDAAVEFAAAIEAGDPEGKAAESLARVNAVIERLAKAKPAAPPAVDTAQK